MSQHSSLRLADSPDSFKTSALSVISVSKSSAIPDAGNSVVMTQVIYTYYFMEVTLSPELLRKTCGVL
jgi:hypothetical protein